MNEKRVFEIALTALVAIILFVSASGGHTNSFYIFLRLVISVGAVYWALRVHRSGMRGWVWAFMILVVLVNPIFPVWPRWADWGSLYRTLGVLLLVWSGYWWHQKA